MSKKVMLLLGMLFFYSFGWANVTSGIQGWWKFEEAPGGITPDSSGRGINGTMVDTAEIVTGGKFGNALHLSGAIDGTTDYVDLGTDNYNITSEFTITAWAKIDATAGTFQEILMRGSGNTYPFKLEIQRYSSNWHIATTVRSASGVYNMAPSSVVVRGDWTNFAVTYKNAELVLYINGIEAARNIVPTGNANLGTPPQRTCIGVTPVTTVNPYPLNGYIDDVRIYNRALSASDVVEVYNGQEPVIDSTPPGVPGNFSAVSVSSYSINLIWTSATDNIGVSGYGIFRGSVFVSSTTGTSYLDNADLDPNTEYTYVLQAYDAAGNISTKLNVSSMTLPGPVDIEAPSDPQSLTAIAISYNQINLMWNASVDNVGTTGYEVYRNDVFISSITSGISYSDTGCVASTFYTYKVLAYDASQNKSAMSAAATATTLAAPIYDVTTGLQGWWKFDETLSGVTSDSSGHNLSGTFHNDASLQQGKYNYALNLTGVHGGVTDYVDFGSGVLPLSSELTVSAWIYIPVNTGNTMVVMQRGRYVDPFIITVVRNNSTTWRLRPGVRTPMPTASVKYYDAGGLISTNTWTHIVMTYRSGELSTYINGAYIGANTTPTGDLNAATVNSLYCGAAPVIYDYPFIGKIDDLRVYNRVLSADDIAGVYSGEEPNIDLIPPSDPTNFNANSISSLSINLSWTASSDNVGVSGYGIFRGSVFISSTTGTSYLSNTGLTPDTAYVYSLRAYDAAGNISTAVIASSRTLVAPIDTQSPSVPASLSAASASVNQIDLTWAASTDNFNVLGYEVYRNNIFVSSVTNGVVFSDIGLSMGTTYSYKVLAYDYSNNKSMQSVSVDAATPGEVAHYIRAGATGTNTGNDWINAWTQLPSTLVRGHTYYIADGEYQPYVFDDAVSGGTYIYIKKAVQSSHGTDSGWDNSYGDDQAIFKSTVRGTPVVTFQTSYWDVDGQMGYGNGSQQQHGFMFYFSTATYYSSSPSYAVLIGNNNNLSYINLRHSEIKSVGCRTEDGIVRGFQVQSTSTLQHGILQYCYIHDVSSMPIYFVGQSNYNIVEYCFIARNHSDPINHAEGIKTYGDGDYNIVRYSTWEDIEGTSIIVGSDYWEVYGNVFYYTYNYPNPGQSGSALGMGIFYADSQNGGHGGINNKVYNNTTYGLRGTNAFVYFETVTGNEVYNNIWVNCQRGRMGNASVASNNYFYGITDFGGYNELNMQMGTDTIFVDTTTYNFRLKNDTFPGKLLSSNYDRDMDGQIRGMDNVWTRGAYEFNAPDITPPSVPSGVILEPVSVSRINLSWTASTDNVGVAGYSVYRDTVFLASTTINSLFDTGLVANMHYRYEVFAYDFLNNKSTGSGVVSAATFAVADVTAPSVPIRFTAVGVSTSQINLSWTASPETDVAGYEVYRGAVFVASTTVVSYSDTGLVAGTTYSYKVLAYDYSLNKSALSTAVECVTKVSAPNPEQSQNPGQPQNPGQTQNPGQPQDGTQTQGGDTQPQTGNEPEQPPQPKPIIVPGVMVSCSNGAIISQPKTVNGVTLTVELAVSPGALPQNGYIDVNTQVTGSFENNVNVINGTETGFTLYNSTGSVVGSSFNGEVTLSMPYADNNNDRIVDGTNIWDDSLRVHVYNDAAQRWELVPGQQKLNRTKKVVEVNLEHFSVYALAPVANAVAVLSVKVYPNPYKPGTGGEYDSANGVYFDNLTESVEIKIFTVSGEQVIQHTKTDTTNRWVWNTKNSAGNNVTSGTYIYMVTDKTTNMKSKGKIVIVR